MLTRLKGSSLGLGLANETQGFVCETLMGFILGLVQKNWSRHTVILANLDVVRLLDVLKGSLEVVPDSLKKDIINLFLQVNK